MSELEAILTIEDKIAFASWLIDSHDARFVPDDDLPEITTHASIDRIAPFLTTNHPGLIFVLSTQWSSQRLHKALAVNKYKGPIHYIQQRYGGPAFTWKPGNILEQFNKPTLVPGHFGDYATYYRCPGSAEIIPRPASMSKAFRDVHAWIKRRSGGRRALYRATGRVGPWISHDAEEMIRNRRANLTRGLMFSADTV